MTFLLIFPHEFRMTLISLYDYNISIIDCFYKLQAVDPTQILTTIKGITSQLEDIKLLLQQLVHQKKRKSDQISQSVSTPPHKKIKLGNSCSPEICFNGMSQVN